jgi:hypothetical protein
VEARRKAHNLFSLCSDRPKHQMFASTETIHGNYQLSQLIKLLYYVPSTIIFRIPSNACIPVPFLNLKTRRPNHNPTQPAHCISPVPSRSFPHDLLRRQRELQLQGQQYCRDPLSFGFHHQCMGGETRLS